MSDGAACRLKALWEIQATHNQALFPAGVGFNLAHHTWCWEGCGCRGCCRHITIAGRCGCCCRCPGVGVVGCKERSLAASTCPRRCRDTGGCGQRRGCCGSRGGGRGLSRRRRAVLLRLIHAPVWVALCRARAAVESVLKRDAHGAVITAQVPVAVLGCGAVGVALARPLVRDRPGHLHGTKQRRQRDNLREKPRLVQIRRDVEHVVGNVLSVQQDCADLQHRFLWERLLKCVCKRQPLLSLCNQCLLSSHNCFTRVLEEGVCV